MQPESRTAATVDELVALTGESNVRQIVVTGRLTGAPTIQLSPGQSLRGAGDGAAIAFADGADGVRLSSDNQIVGIQLHASPG